MPALTPTFMHSLNEAILKGSFVYPNYLWGNQLEGKVLRPLDQRSKTQMSTGAGDVMEMSEVVQASEELA